MRREWESMNFGRRLRSLSVARSEAKESRCEGEEVEKHLLLRIFHPNAGVECGPGNHQKLASDYSKQSLHVTSTDHSMDATT